MTQALAAQYSSTIDSNPDHDLSEIGMSRSKPPSDQYDLSGESLREIESSFAASGHVELLKLEQLSRLVALAGATNLREFAKRLAFDAESELRRYWSSSGDARNSYSVPARSEESEQLRAERLHQIQQSEQHTPIGHRTVLHHYDVPIAGLGAGLDGLSILHLSDIHFRAGKSDRSIALGALKTHLNHHQIVPDLVILTGDIITNRAEDLSAEALSTLSGFRANIARLFVAGNHDFYNGAISKVRDLMRQIGYTDLTDSQLRLRIDNATLNLFGVDDHLEGKPKSPPILAEHSRETNIVLTHNLDAVQRHFPKEIDLVLSGHTHAGEVSIGRLNGCHFMRLFRYIDFLNGHIRGWDTLTDRTLSYISPGHAGHYFRFNTVQAGGTLLKLRAVN